MSEYLEQQEEELEALLSIYEGDVAFKQIDATTFQYKYGEEDDIKSFLVEVKWGETYPAEQPTINMDTFYNRHLTPAVKAKVKEALIEEAQQWLGCGMTYTLFECIKDRLDELTAAQPETTQATELDTGVGAIRISDNADSTKKKEMKKEQMTKAQKRRQWEQTDHKGERARGWNWVDVIKHLSQTGSKDHHKDTTAASSTGGTSILQPLNI